MRASRAAKLLGIASGLVLVMAIAVVGQTWPPGKPAAPRANGDDWRAEMTKFVEEVAERLKTSDDLAEAATKQKIAVEQARGVVKGTEVDVRVAEIELESFRDGHWPRWVKSADAQIAAAEESVSRSKEKLETLERGLAKNPDDALLLRFRIDDRAVLKRSEEALDSAKKSRENLDRFSEPKERTAREAEIEKAKTKLIEAKSALTRAKWDEAILERKQLREELSGGEQGALNLLAYSIALDDRVSKMPADAADFKRPARSKFEEARGLWSREQDDRRAARNVANRARIRRGRG